jgi:cyclopropane fatty-acyl-phospholipid synthase-like methyltransferase
MDSKMNERIQELALQAGAQGIVNRDFIDVEKFAELIVKEMCGMMEQTEDDAYHCFEPSERPTEYIEWLNQWRTRFEKHFGVEE